MDPGDIDIRRREPIDRPVHGVGNGIVTVETEGDEAHFRLRVDEVRERAVEQQADLVATLLDESPARLNTEILDGLVVVRFRAHVFTPGTNPRSGMPRGGRGRKPPR
jgi:hypothetical protein